MTEALAPPPARFHLQPSDEGEPCPAEAAATRQASAINAPTRRTLLILLLIAVVARLATFGDPLVHADEQFYFVVAKAMAHGQLPYVDIWDRKPIGLFLLYLPAALLPLPWGTLAYQLLSLGCVVATALLVTRFAARAGWARGATAAGIAYVLWLELLNGSSGQSPVFYNLPVALAALLTATRPGRRGAGLAAMALLGIAMQVKPSAVFEGVFLGLWLLGDEWRARRSLSALAAYGAALIALALLPTLAAYVFYASRGLGPFWLQANINGILTRRPDPPIIQLKHGLSLLLVLSPLIAMAGGSRGQALDGDARLRLFLRCWFATVLGGIVLFGGWYDHYGLPAVAPGAACAAGFLGGRGRRFAIPILGLAALTGQITIGINRWNHGERAQLDAVARAIGRGPEALFVYSGPPVLYGETDRPGPTRYLFPSHLYLAREEGSIGTRQADEIRRVFARRPLFVVMAPQYKNEQPRIRALTDQLVGRDYTRQARFPLGTKYLDLYRLSRSAPGPMSGK